MSLPEVFQRPHTRALLIGGGIILLLAIALYFATRKKTDPLAASNPNGLNADASGAVPTVLVLPPPVVQLGQQPPLPSSPPTQLMPPPLPVDGSPVGVLAPSPIGLPPAPTPPPYVLGLTGPTGIHS